MHYSGQREKVCVHHSLVFLVVKIVSVVEVTSVHYDLCCGINTLTLSYNIQTHVADSMFLISLIMSTLVRILRLKWCSAQSKLMYSQLNPHLYAL